jgi:hypothetical protein
MDAGLIVTKAIANASFFVNDALTLFGDIHELQLNVVDFYPFFKTSSSMKNMNQKLSLLVPFIESYANSVLDQGWRLPIP